MAMQSYSTLCERKKRIREELISVSENITKLNANQDRYKASINDLTEEIESNETASIALFVSNLFKNEYLHII